MMKPAATRLLLIALLATPGVARGDSFALILGGIPGTPEHEARFNHWTDQTREILTTEFGFPEGDVAVLREPNADEVRSAFASFAGRADADDVFYLFLIGHGSYDGKDYKFNIARTDLTGAEYSDLISSVGAGRSVVINATTSSGASIEALRAPNRIIVTATRTGTERSDTIFFDQFLEALTDSASDADLNDRLSVWEAFRYAALGVARHYEELNLLATEHPQISDNGGEQSDAETEEIPTLAQLTHFNTATASEVSDPGLRALLDDRGQLEAGIVALRAKRDSLSQDEYDRQLEDLLVELALKNQEIRAREGEQ